MIRVAAVGDLMLGDSSITVGFGVHSRYPGGQLEAVFRDLAPRLRAADLAIGNLECPLTAVGQGDSRWARDQMRGDVAYARVLRNAGFTALAVGNNHATQHGERVFHETVAALRDAGILVLGLRGTRPWHAEPVTFHAKTGERAALLAYSWRPRQYGTGPAPYADVDENAVLADVERARASHDAVIVSLHWGEEFIDQPSDVERRFALALVERGADALIGHHPHVVRPIERRDSAVLAYSLGNAVTDMLWMPPLREGALLEFDLTPRPSNVRVTPVRSDDRYCARLGPTSPVDRDVAITTLDDAEYRRRGAAGLSKQRSAAYAYLARNALQYPPAVLATLVTTTASNKLRGLMRRAKPAAR